MRTVIVTGRDRAMLRAVAAGRCQLDVGCEPVLLVDGLVCAESGAGQRLVEAGLILPADPASRVGPALLTSIGRDALAD